MQTFIPLSPEQKDNTISFRNSAKVLDRMRLGKQRVEGYQILQTLLGISNGWKNHPAVKMWAGHEFILFRYVVDICDEWISRGYKDTIKEKISKFNINSNTSIPSWLFNSNFTASHRSNLLRKFPEWYNKFGWNEPNNLPYVWPL